MQNKKEKEMNKAQDIKSCNELAQMLSNVSEGQRIVVEHAIEATYQYEQVKQSLEGAIEYCKRQLERAQRSLAEDGRVSSLGILQANGVDVDRLCGELSRSREAAKAAQRLLNVLVKN